MGKIEQFHLERIESGLLETYTVEMLPEWISSKTKIGGKPYSFKDHEFQEVILRDPSQEKNVRKCSQVGLSEISARGGLGLCGSQKHYTVIYTLPTAAFATVFMSTRIDPVIRDSPYLKAAMAKGMDNTGIKQIGDSYLYLKGAQSNNAPISVPADHLIHDELDFSDEQVISNYQSRLSHSPHKRKWRFSTPTAPGVGIDKEFQMSRRYWNFVKCDHCNHWFVPDYFKHVRIPEFNGDIRGIRKPDLHKLKFMEAYVECPSCARMPSLQFEHRSWVCENPDENHVAAGWQVQPFDAPNVIKPGDLIKSSTEYASYTDFINFSLGLPALDREETLVEEELRSIIVATGEVLGRCNVMGLDLGLWCHIVIMAVNNLDPAIIIFTEVVHVTELRVRCRELRRIFRVRVTVADSLPYTETVLAMQREDKNLYASVYVNSKSVITHDVVQRDENDEKGKQQIRQVNVYRNKAFDGLMGALKFGEIMKKTDENDKKWIAHLLDMRRAKAFVSDDNELSFVWKKGSGEDHFHHATLYAWIASQMVGVAGPAVSVPVVMGRVKFNG